MTSIPDAHHGGDTRFLKLSKCLLPPAGGMLLVTNICPKRTTTAGRRVLQAGPTISWGTVTEKNAALHCVYWFFIRIKSQNLAQNLKSSWNHGKKRTVCPIGLSTKSQDEFKIVCRTLQASQRDNFPHGMLAQISTSNGFFISKYRNCMKSPRHIQSASANLQFPACKIRM